MDSTPRLTTIRPNCTEVEANGMTYLFSYSTCVGFYGPRGRIMRQNDWGPTTGKHLNHWDGGDKQAKAQRVPEALFLTLLHDAERLARS